MSLMQRETLETPACLRRFLAEGLGAALAAGRAMRAAGVTQLETLGRGSSSHAGTVLRYAFAGATDLRIAAAMPSRAARPLPAANWAGVALIAISQSGRSPDLVRYVEAARDARTCRIGLINIAGSPLGAAVEHEALLCAGPEKAVAATKTVVLSIAAGLGVLAGYADDEALVAALQALPEKLEAAADCDWSALTDALAGAPAAYTLGRGGDFGVAKEIALKVSEAVGAPALAFSSAEFLHGPLGAVSAATPVLGIVSDARDFPSVLEALARARGQGARTLLAHGFPSSSAVPRADLPLPAPVGSPVDVITALIPAYLAIERAAQAAGRDPDRPQGLAKVTETL